MREVFGKAFFDDDPSLMEDPCANSCPAAERIDQLFREVDDLLHTKGDNRIVKFVLFNSLDYCVEGRCSCRQPCDFFIPFL